MQQRASSHVAGFSCNVLKQQMCVLPANTSPLHPVTAIALLALRNIETVLNVVCGESVYVVESA